MEACNASCSSEEGTFAAVGAGVDISCILEISIEQSRFLLSKYVEKEVLHAFEVLRGIQKALTVEVMDVQVQEKLMVLEQMEESDRYSIL